MSNFAALTTVITTSYSNTGLNASTPCTATVSGGRQWPATLAAAPTSAALATPCGSGYHGAHGAHESECHAPISSSSINLSWTASTDNVGVTGYQVHRCQGATCTNYAQVGTATGTNYRRDGSLAAATTYRYEVRATDAAGT